MKVIFLLIFGVVLKPAAAQDPLLIMKEQLKRPTSLNSFNTLSTGNNNYVQLYLRSEINRKILCNYFHIKEIKRTDLEIKAFTYFNNAPTFFSINKTFLNNKIELTAGQSAMNKFTEVLGGVLDIFLEQYSISNRMIH